MSTPLLTTKIRIPPVRPNLVSRPRLIEQLNEGLPRQSGGLARKLTLISAPAGFGKTTLVSEWVQAMGRAPPPIAVAWLALDEGDNDLARFLTYFIAALQKIEAGCEHAGNIGTGALSALGASQPQPPPTEAILISLINDIAAIPERIVLVLDDYHNIESSPVDATLTFLLEHLPPRMHLVMATREDPSLPLARLRARGQLTELRATDLRFTSSEAADFLNQAMGLDLAPDDVAALETRTEGWIAGLQLAAISMQGRKDASSRIKSFAGSHRFVLDYLIEEVLEQQSKSVQSFLLKTAVLDRLTGPLCDAVLLGTAEEPDRSEEGASSEGSAVRFGTAKSPNGRVTLEMLERANLFIVPLDDERRWYRYHQLFADLLRQRLRQTQPEQLPVLHRRASVWYERNGFTNEAIEHALRSEDFDRAAELIEEHVDDIWQFGEHTELQRWLDEIPVEVTYSKPHLCILDAGNLFTTGQVDEAERRLRAAEQALAPSTISESGTVPIETDQLLAPDKMKLWGRAAVVRSHLLSYQGDAEGSIQYARQALEFLPKRDTTWRWSAFDSMGTVYSFIDDASAYQARLAALEASKAAGNAYMILLASLRLVVTLRDLGRLQQAIELCQQQSKLARESGLSQTALVGWLYTLWGEILAETNELDNALQLVNKGVALTKRGKDVTLRGSSYLCLIRVLFSRGDMDSTKRQIKEVNHLSLKQDLSPWITNQMEAWQARICLAQDRLASAYQWAEKIELEVDGELSPIHDFDYAVLARILIAQGRLDETFKLLRRLCAAAEAGGRTSKVIEILILQALASQARGDTSQAVTILERALTLAEPGGFIRIFVDEGPPMARLLYKALSRGIAPDYVGRLLSAFPIAEPEQADRLRAQVPKSHLIEPLSERELEVLRLIADGLTNPEIASRLYLSLNTVKAHTRNIYCKLDAHSRTQAVARGRAVGVLSFT